MARGLLATSWGFFCIVFGVAAIVWSSYLLFVENTEGVEPFGFVRGYAIGLAAIGVGVWRIRGDRKSTPADQEG